jgi:acetyl esterase
MPVRIYSPKDGAADLPLIVFFHGGGYISGNALFPSFDTRRTQAETETQLPTGTLTSEEGHCRIIAARTPAIVVNIDYPLGPTHNIDTIIESGVVSVNWAASHSPPLTTSSKLLVAGGSAGASLAVRPDVLRPPRHPSRKIKPVC